MSKNYETVSLIIHDPKEIVIWINDGRITKKDVKIAIEYIKEQELLSEDEFENRVKYLTYTQEAFTKLSTMHKSGIGVDEVIKILKKTVDLIDDLD